MSRFLFGHVVFHLRIITDMFMSNNTGVGVIVLIIIFQILFCYRYRKSLSFDYSDNYGFNLKFLNNDFSKNIADVHTSN